MLKAIPYPSIESTRQANNLHIGQNNFEIPPLFFKIYML